MCGRVPQDRPLELWVISNFRVSNLIFSLSFILKAWPLIKKSAISQSQNHLVFSGFVSYHHHRKVVQCAMVIFPGSTKRLTFCFGFDFFSTTNQNFVKTLNFHLCLRKYLVLKNQNLALKNQNLGFLQLISFDFHSILGFLSLSSHAATQGLSTLLLWPLYFC